MGAAGTGYERVDEEMTVANVMNKIQNIEAAIETLDKMQINMGDPDEMGAVLKAIEELTEKVNHLKKLEVLGVGC